MNEIDYNARLYEKMKAEQDKYRDWLLHQEPAEILNHTYEYTMREDIVRWSRSTIPWKRCRRWSAATLRNICPLRMRSPSSAMRRARGEIIVEQAMGDPVQKEGQAHQNPTVAKTEKSPPSERSSTIGGSNADRGTAKQADKKPSVREKLERYKAAVKADKEADRTEPSIAKERPKASEPSRQTVHRQPKRTKKPKER